MRKDEERQMVREANQKVFEAAKMWQGSIDWYGSYKPLSPRIFYEPDVDLADTPYRERSPSDILQELSVQRGSLFDVQGKMPDLTPNQKLLELGAKVDPLPLGREILFTGRCGYCGQKHTDEEVRCTYCNGAL